MRQYRIKEIDLGFIIYKEIETDWVKTKLYWNGKRRDCREESAKTYLFQDDALSSLVIIKKRWNEPC